jgi:two-component sensor histidine kinase
MHARIPTHASGEAALEFDARDTDESARGGDRYYAPVVKSSRDARAAVLVLPLGSDRKERAVLVVSELTTNAIVHAGGVLYLQVFQYDSGVRLEVADASPRRPGPIKVNLTSGRGLQMVEALARAWGWAPKPWGKVVWAELE